MGGWAHHGGGPGEGEACLWGGVSVMKAREGLWAWGRLVSRCRVLMLPSPSSLPSPAAGLSTEKAAAFTRRLRAEPQFLLAQNVATCSDPLEVCLQRQVVQDTIQVFQHAVPAEGKPVTNQKNSGKWGLWGTWGGWLPPYGCRNLCWGSQIKRSFV